MLNSEKSNKELENNQQESLGDYDKKLYEEVFQNAPIGIYVLDKEGKIIAFNPKMVELSGAKSFKEVVGLNVFETPTYKEVGLDTFFREGLEGKVSEIETRYVSYTGQKESYRHYFGVPILNPESDKVERLLLLVEDITERIKVEQVLKRKNDSLERLNNLMVSRETEVSALKAEVEKLKDDLDKCGKI